MVMVKQPGHLTSMKKERGVGTRVYYVLVVQSIIPCLEIDMSGGSYLELVLTGLGLRRRVEEVDRENLSTFNVRSHSHDSYDSFGMFIVLGMIFFFDSRRWRGGGDGGVGCGRRRGRQSRHRDPQAQNKINRTRVEQSKPKYRFEGEEGNIPS